MRQLEAAQKEKELVEKQRDNYSLRVEELLENGQSLNLQLQHCQQDLIRARSLVLLVLVSKKKKSVLNCWMSRWKAAILTHRINSQTQEHLHSSKETREMAVGLEEKVERLRAEVLHLHEENAKLIMRVQQEVRIKKNIFVVLTLVLKKNCLVGNKRRIASKK